MKQIIKLRTRYIYYRSWLLRLEWQELTVWVEVWRVMSEMGWRGKKKLRVAGEQRGKGIGHWQMLH